MKEKIIEAAFEVCSDQGYSDEVENSLDETARILAVKYHIPESETEKITDILRSLLAVSDKECFKEGFESCAKIMSGQAFLLEVLS